MALPDFQTMMRPCLVALSDGGEHSQQEVRDAVAAALGVTDDERQILLPKGRQPKFSNRVGWALTHMRNAGSVEWRARPVCHHVRGLQVLNDFPQRIDMKVLATFPEYARFRAGGLTPPPVEAVVQPAHVDTPNDAVAALIDAAHEALAADLLARVYERPPKFLERTALALLQAMGYGGREGGFDHTGGSGDRGLDGVVRQDALGLDRIGVQAKRYDPGGAPVPGKEVQAFVGAPDEVAAHRGVFVTTARFSKAAIDYAERASKRVVLIDGAELARLMLKYGVGVQEQQHFVLLQPDEVFFEE